MPSASASQRFLEMCGKIGLMLNRFSPMIFAAAYSLLMPLVLGALALWDPLTTRGIANLKDWQTLVGGVLAIAAAAVGGLFILNQTAETRRHEDERLARQHAAARAVLPLALSALVDYAERVATGLESLRGTMVGRRVVGTPATPFIAPELDPGAISALRDVIESASPPIGQRIAMLISEVQILSSRLRDVSSALRPGSHSLVLSLNILEYTLNAAVIFARGSALFGYARLETDEAPAAFPTEQDLITALNLLGFDESTHEEMYQVARARAARHHTSPA